EQTQTVYKDTRKLATVASNMVDAALKGKKPETLPPVGWPGSCRTAWSGPRPTLRRYFGLCALVSSRPAATAPA
ncbi:hypothetical protein AB0885_32415, partial [Streptomyces sp. NPDC005534]|uniref:hypothetical protein n=1 Tax=Streptomyces sp. NPDC005534 TaxID=3155714 RepID=UPI0034549F67